MIQHLIGGRPWVDVRKGSSAKGDSNNHVGWTIYHVGWTMNFLFDTK